MTTALGDVHLDVRVFRHEPSRRVSIISVASAPRRVSVLNMMIGLIHPPFGMLLFVTKALTGIPIGEMMKEGWPFLVMLLLLLLAMTFFPQIVLWLPQTMGYVTR